jgi:hypothetical protein
MIFAVANPATGRILETFYTEEAANLWLISSPRAARYPDLVVVALTLPN